MKSVAVDAWTVSLMSAQKLKWESTSTAIVWQFFQEPEDLNVSMFQEYR